MDDRYRDQVRVLECYRLGDEQSDPSAVDPFGEADGVPFALYSMPLKPTDVVGLVGDSEQESTGQMLGQCYQREILRDVKEQGV